MKLGDFQPSNSPMLQLGGELKPLPTQLLAITNMPPSKLKVITATLERLRAIHPKATTATTLAGGILLRSTLTARKLEVVE